MRVMIISNDVEDSEKLKDSLMDIKEIERVDYFDDGKLAFEAIIKETYEIIVFELFLPGKDGIDILNLIKLMKFRQRPILFALIPTANKIFVNECIELGVDYLFYKPYNRFSIYSRLKLIIDNYEDIIYNNKEVLVMSQISTIEDTLNTFNFKKSNLGYKYLVYSVYLCMENEELLNNITKGLYIEVGKKFNSNLKNVERSMRHLIKSQFEKDSETFFGIEVKNRQPSNSQFIAHVVKLTKNDYIIKNSNL